MKLLGKEKKTNRRIILVTEYEWEIITQALFEYNYGIQVTSSDPKHKRDLTTVENRIRKAENDFSKLIEVSENQIDEQFKIE